MEKVKLTDQIDGIIRAAIENISSTNKEYITETITSVEKKKSIQDISDITNFRIIKSIEAAHTCVTTALTKEGFSPREIEKVKKLLNECM